MDIMLQRISELLLEQKKSQKDLTDFLGITQNSYTNWKSGRNSSYKKYKYAIADFLDVTVDYLDGTSNEKNKPLVQKDEEPKENTIKIAGRNGKYIEKRLTDEQIDTLSKMVEALPDADDL